jgi:type IV pilus assembly protein PilY1
LTTSTTSTTGNGLAAPVVWQDSASNGVSTKAWAGDLNGAVWQFVLNNIDSNGGTDAPTPSSAGTQVFHATDSAGNDQPITAGMLAGEDPSTGNVWVFFGTGRYLTSIDWSNLAPQTWYGVIVENNSGTALSCSNSGSSVSCGTRGALVERDIVYEQPASSTELAARVITTSGDATPVNNTIATGGLNSQGWYLDLLEPAGNTSGPDGGELASQQGERMVTPNQFEGNLLLGTTRLPLASDPCNPSGSGWIMAISPFTGTNPEASFFDINNDGAVNTGDMLTVNGQQVPAAGIGFSSLPNNPIFVGTEMMTSFNNGSRGNNTTSGATGTPSRVSWRELVTQ